MYIFITDILKFYNFIATVLKQCWNNTYALFCHFAYQENKPHYKFINVELILPLLFKKTTLSVLFPLHDEQWNAKLQAMVADDLMNKEG